LFLTIIGIATVILFHDYLGHVHLDFLHDLLRDDLAIKEHEPLTQSTLTSGNGDTIQSGVVVNCVSHTWLPADNVNPMIGFYRLYAGLSPPDENIRRVNAFYELISGLSPPAAASHRSIGLKYETSLILLIPAFSLIFPETYSLSLSYSSLHRASASTFPGLSGMEFYKRHDNKSASAMLRQLYINYLHR